MHFLYIQNEGGPFSKYGPPPKHTLYNMPTAPEYRIICRIHRRPQKINQLLVFDIGYWYWST